MRKIVILGSTGSVGRQSCEVAVSNSINVAGISAHTGIDLAEKQARELKCKYVAITDEKKASELKARLSDSEITVFSGAEGVLLMLDACAAEGADTLINAIVGRAALAPAYRALCLGMHLATANKESLVCAGEMLKAKAGEKNLDIIPIDSEHSAVWQCLKSGRRCDVKRLILTASGGPFFGKKKSELEGMSASDALAHPTWSMGQKITVDSASMMNKGFEIIEACHLFDIPAEKIDVLVHRESIVHSMVEYIDGAVIAQLGLPDMRTCVALSLSYPKRWEAVSGQYLELAKIGSLSFFPPDDDTFPTMNFARHAIGQGGMLPSVLNAADEAAVRLFLSGKIKFTGIFDIIEKNVHNYINEKIESIEHIEAVSDEIEAKICEKY